MLLNTTTVKSIIMDLSYLKRLKGIMEEKHGIKLDMAAIRAMVKLLEYNMMLFIALNKVIAIKDLFIIYLKNKKKHK